MMNSSGTKMSKCISRTNLLICLNTLANNVVHSAAKIGRGRRRLSNFLDQSA